MNYLLVSDLISYVALAFLAFDNYLLNKRLEEISKRPPLVVLEVKNLDDIPDVIDSIKSYNAHVSKRPEV